MTIFHKFTRITLIYKATATILNTKQPVCTVLIKCMVSWYFYSLHIKHKKIQVKKFKQGCFQIVGIHRNVFPFSQLFVLNSDRNIRGKLTPCFVLTVLGRYSLLQWSRRNQTAKYHSRTSLVTLFSKASSDMSNLEMMPSPGGIITDVNRAAEDSFTQKTANQHTSLPA